MLLLVVGVSSGVWLAACYFRPLLDAANTDMIMAMQFRDSLENLAGEQGKKLSELAVAGELRERKAALAMVKAKVDAQPD